MEIGMNIVHRSPRRAEIERRLQAQEAVWQQLR
jgi:DNA polymerase III psi subunit